MTWADSHGCSDLDLPRVAGAVVWLSFTTGWCPLPVSMAADTHSIVFGATDEP
jgi:hypothetical protein